MKPLSSFKMSTELEYHLNNGIRVSECVFMYGSDKFCDLIVEVREGHAQSKYMVYTESEVFENTDGITFGKLNSHDVQNQLRVGKPIRSRWPDLEFNSYMTERKTHRSLACGM